MSRRMKLGFNWRSLLAKITSVDSLLRFIWTFQPTLCAVTKRRVPQHTSSIVLKSVRWSGWTFFFNLFKLSLSSGVHVRSHDTVSVISGSHLIKRQILHQYDWLWEQPALTHFSLCLFLLTFTPPLLQDKSLAVCWPRSPSSDTSKFTHHFQASAYFIVVLTFAQRSSLDFVVFSVGSKTAFGNHR